MAILFDTPENPLLWAFLIEIFNLGIAKMSVTPENPLFPNPVLPKTSVLLLELDSNSPRQFIYEMEGIRQSSFYFFALPEGFTFKKYCPWKGKIIKTLDRVRIEGLVMNVQGTATHEERGRYFC